jgi:hypothetical protein
VGCNTLVYVIHFEMCKNIRTGSMNRKTFYLSKMILIFADVVSDNIF